jgi:hypothetical protein
MVQIRICLWSGQCLLEVCLSFYSPFRICLYFNPDCVSVFSFFFFSPVTICTLFQFDLMKLYSRLIACYFKIKKRFRLVNRQRQQTFKGKKHRVKESNLYAIPMPSLKSLRYIIKNNSLNLFTFKSCSPYVSLHLKVYIQNEYISFTNVKYEMK